ncbi:MAG: hypothetical protein KDL87_10890, partial [Verrucomicrobiae bacterium]|nr:hypothetical protein [Verrucomicrobiae bacterium]
IGIIERLQRLESGIVPIPQDGECLVFLLPLKRSEDGGDDAHARRQVARDPVQPVRAVRGVELVERIEDENDAPFLSGFREQFL